ncbi:MAG: hypothetical protein ACLQVK_08225 [Acidimicrobiales bacterium]
MCRSVTIAAVVATACPELSEDDIAGALGATITSPAVARDLAVALATGPSVLRAGAPPVVARLVAELRARGSVLPVPACAICKRTGLALIRVGTIGLCGRCRAHQLAEACSVCERVRVVTARTDEGGALCFACKPRPARPCGRCGRVAPVARRASGVEPDICNGCFRLPVATCGSCGRRKPCFFVAARNPICISCSPRATAACAHCHRMRPPSARWPEGPVCEPCYRAALARRGACEACGQARRLVAPPGADARLCADCAAVEALARCATCGIEDRLYHHHRCVRCALAERAACLLAGPRPELVGVYDAIVAARQPYSAHNWLRSAVAASILADVASGEMALSHDALDAHPNTRAAGFLRQLLVAHDVLPARDEALIALETWVTDQLRRVSDPSEGRLLRSYATWRVLRRARARAASRPRPRTATGYAKTNLLAAIAFLSWLAERGVKLGEVGQGDIDSWSVEGGPAAHELADFLDWAVGRKLLAAVVLAGRHRQEGTAMNPDTRWVIVDRLLHDDGVALTDRVAGCLVLLYAQQLSHIVALAADQVITADDGVYLQLGPAPAIIPEPLGGLLVELATNGRSRTGVGSPASSVWLFPGLHAGRPLHPSTLGQRLRRLDVPTMSARRAALMHLASKLPAAVLAEMLHLHPTTAVHWVAAAGGDWSTYAAQIAREH